MSSEPFFPLLSSKIAKIDDDCIAWYCLGCRHLHPVQINRPANDPTAHSWAWNGDVIKPSFSPSIVTRMAANQLCHCFVVGGTVKYLKDCTHHYADQTIELPDIPPEAN